MSVGDGLDSKGDRARKPFAIVRAPRPALLSQFGKPQDHAAARPAPARPDRPRVSEKGWSEQLPRRCDSYVLAAFPELPGEKFAVCRQPQIDAGKPGQITRVSWTPMLL